MRKRGDGDAEIFAMNKSAESDAAAKKECMNDGVMRIDIMKLRVYIIGPDAGVESEKIREPTKEKEKPEKKKLFPKGEFGFLFWFLMGGS